MAIPENDRDLRQSGAFREDTNTSMIGIVAAAVILGLIMLYMLVPRSDTPTMAISNPTQPPATTTVPRDTTPVTPNVKPKQP